MIKHWMVIVGMIALPVMGEVTRSHGGGAHEEFAERGREETATNGVTTDNELPPPRDPLAEWERLNNVKTRHRDTFDAAGAERLVRAFENMRTPGASGERAAEEFIEALRAAYPPEGPGDDATLIRARQFLATDRGPTVTTNLRTVGEKLALEKAREVLAGIGPAATRDQINAMARLYFLGESERSVDAENDLAGYMSDLTLAQFQVLASRLPKEVRISALNAYQIAADRRREVTFEQLRHRGRSALLSPAATDPFTEWMAIQDILRTQTSGYGQEAFNRFVGNLRSQLGSEGLTTEEDVRRRLGITPYHKYYGFKVPAVGKEGGLASTHLPDWPMGRSPGLFNQDALLRYPGVLPPRESAGSPALAVAPPPRVSPNSGPALPSATSANHTPPASAPAVPVAPPAAVAASAPLPVYSQAFPGAPLVPISGVGPIFVWNGSSYVQADVTPPSQQFVSPMQSAPQSFVRSAPVSRSRFRLFPRLRR